MDTDYNSQSLEYSTMLGRKNSISVSEEESQGCGAMTRHVINEETRMKVRTFYLPKKEKVEKKAEITCRDTDRLRRKEVVGVKMGKNLERAEKLILEKTTGGVENGKEEACEGNSTAVGELNQFERAGEEIHESQDAEFYIKPMQHNLAKEEKVHVKNNRKPVSGESRNTKYS